MLSVILSKQAEKFLAKLPAKQKRQIAKKIMAMRLNPFPNDHKKLKGHAPYCRVDSGEYRIIYKVENEDQLLLVAIITKRNDDQAYRILSRKR